MRLSGGFQAIGGGSEAFLGGAACGGSGVGCLIGVPVMAHGADQFQTGIQKLWTGQDVDSLTSQGLQAAGVSRNWANGIDAGISVVGSLGAGSLANSVKVVTGGDEFVDVYRVFGGDARAQGFSWTTTDPRSVSNFRDLAGLPSGGASGATNTADFLIQGKANIKDIITSRPALPLDGNKGGLAELIIDPKNVNLTDFSVIKR